MAIKGVRFRLFQRPLPFSSERTVIAVVSQHVICVEPVREVSSSDGRRRRGHGGCFVGERKKKRVTKF